MQVEILIFLVKIKFLPIYANIFCGAGQVPILRYFEICKVHVFEYIRVNTLVITGLDKQKNLALNCK